MSDQPPPPPSTSSGPGPAIGTGAPGYDTQQHLPPPPIPPLNIPQNTNPIPTAISSPMNNGQNLMSPQSAGGYLRRAAPEPNKRALYVGGLDPRVTEDMLKQIFETGTGSHVMSVKIIPDKNVGDTQQQHTKGLNYGFVEFDDPASAERALQTLNGRKVHNTEIRVNWAYQSNTNAKEDTSNHFHIFVGDLSNEVNDEILQSAFSAFGQISEARVMWDMKTGRSRGYGFVAYKDREDAQKAISAMDGEWLGSRAIRCNWANQKGQPSYAQQQAMVQAGLTPATPYSHPPFPSGGMQAYEQVLSQAPSTQTTVYVGNLTPYTTQNDLQPLFLNFGQIVETRMQADRGFAFFRLESHEAAAAAICQLNGYNVHGRPMKCSWGKDRPVTMTFDQNQSPHSGYPYSPQQQQGPNSGYPQSGYAPQSAGGAYPPHHHQYNQYGGMTSPQPQSAHSYGNSPYQQYPPQSAGGFNRPPPGGPPPHPPQGQWPQHSSSYGPPPPQGYGYQG